MFLPPLRLLLRALGRACADKPCGKHGPPLVIGWPWSLMVKHDLQNGSGPLYDLAWLR